MRKSLSIFMVCFLVIGIIGTTNLFTCAALSSSSGLGLIDGAEYYIYNVYENTNQYIFDRFFISAPTQTNGQVNVNLTIEYGSYQWGSQYYKWKVHKQNDGTFLLESVNQKFLRIDEGNVVLHYNLGMDDQVFRIDRVDDENKEGTYTIKNGDKYLSVSYYGFELLDEPNDMSYWTFMKASKGEAYCSGYDYYTENFDTSGIVTDVAMELASWGYNCYWQTEPVSATRTLDYMINSDISILTGLGQAGAIITNPYGGTNSMLMAEYELTQGSMQEYVNSLSDNALAKSRCIIYLSSYSGSDAMGNDGESYNLVNATYEKGAHYVLGFTSVVSQTLANEWLEEFWEHVVINDNNLGQAVRAACISTGLYDGSPSNPDFSEYIHYRGDGTQYLSF